MSVMNIVAKAVETKLGRAVEEFLVSPPLDPAFRKFAVLDRLRSHMAKAFPKLTFIVGTDFPFKHATDFVVMPIMGVANPTNPDAMVMCRKPTQQEMDGIYAALEAFEPDAPSSFFH